MKKNKTNLSEYYSISQKDSIVEIIFHKPIVLSNARYYEMIFKNDIIFNGTDDITLNFSKTEEYDSYLVVFINTLKKYCNSKDIEIKVTGLKPIAESYLQQFSREPKEEQNEIKIPFFKAYFSNIGIFVLLVLSDTRKFIEYLGELITKLVVLLIHPNKMRWSDFPMHFTRSGVNALPIVALIVFLIGLISGYQGAIQLQMVGADIYIADIVGLSITRELGPLMTAIIIAGRSGSAFAAEIGTMSVSEEIDALKTMGFDITNFLVLPRVLAVSFSMPLLTILANLAGIVGGFISSSTILNITLSGYVNQLQRAVGIDDIFSGILKSIIFGFLVATVGCFRGLQVKGSAEQVGKTTTIAVVNGILLIILSDTVFTFLFKYLGI